MDIGRIPVTFDRVLQQDHRKAPAFQLNGPLETWFCWVGPMRAKFFNRFRGTIRKNWWANNR